MYHVSAQCVDERMIYVYYYYKTQVFVVVLVLRISSAS